MSKKKRARNTNTARTSLNRRRRLAGFFGVRGVRPSLSRVKNSGPQPVAAHVFSGRFVLGLAILAFIVIAAYAPLSTFLSQQAEINQVKSNISSLQSENEQLQTQLSWWEDDNYVKQQARSRLFYVSEGETPYLVTGTDYTSNFADDTSAAAQTAPEQSWTNSLWSSFQESAFDSGQDQTSQNTLQEGKVTPDTGESTGQPGDNSTASSGE